jgi:hypothetical protein
MSIETISKAERLDVSLLFRDKPAQVSTLDHCRSLSTYFSQAEVDEGPVAPEAV